MPQAGAVARIAPFAAYVVTRAVIDQVYPGNPPLATYPILIVVTVGTLLIFRRHYAELRAPFVANGRELLISVVVGLAVLAVWVGIDTPLLRLADTKSFTPLDAQGDVLWPWVILRIVGSALMIPVVEELFWRSFFMRWLDGGDYLVRDPRCISWRALILGSVPFALEHAELFAGLVAGLAYAWLYKHSGRIWPPVIAHGVSNLGLGIWIVATGQWTYW